MAGDNKQKTLLHELLREDQEPFHLSKYTSERSLLGKLLPPVKRRRAEAVSNLCRHACFFSLQGAAGNAAAGTKSPFLELRSPVVIRSKSLPSNSQPNGAMDVPARVAPVVLEAALRMQKPRRKTESISSSPNGSRFVGSFLKKLIKSSSSKKSDLKTTTSSQKVERSVETASSSSSSCGARDTKSSSEEDDDDSANREFDFPGETRFCMSPFVFSVRRSPTSSVGFSPVGSPSRPATVKENAKNSEEEQCSPVSVLDPPLDEGGGNLEKEEEEGGEDDDYDLESSYANLQRAKQQLLRRLGQFEKLAKLDPIELERRSTTSEASDDDEIKQNPSSENEVPHSTKRSLGFDKINTMIELTFKKEGGRWTELGDQVQETAHDLESSILDSLMEELI